MKKTTLLLFVALIFFSSCSHYKEIGNLNVISTRNFSLKENYTALKNYAGTSKREKKKNRSKTIDGAVNNLVKSVPGGEFIQNVKVLTNGRYYVVTGDVYGFGTSANFAGFKIGDKVIWKKLFTNRSGIITELINSDYCLVKDNKSEKLHRIRYEDITKVN